MGICFLENIDIEYQNCFSFLLSKPNYFLQFEMGYAVQLFCHSYKRMTKTAKTKQMKVSLHTSPSKTLFYDAISFHKQHLYTSLVPLYATVALLKRLSINHCSLLWGSWYPSNMTVIAKGFHWDHPRSSLLMNWPKQHEKQRLASLVRPINENIVYYTWQN